MPTIAILLLRRTLLEKVIVFVILTILILSTTLHLNKMLAFSNTITTQSPLTIQNGKFYSKGEEIVLRGAVLNHFLYKSTNGVVRSDIDWLKKNGANLVIIQWNALHLEKNTYIQELIQTSKYAKMQGLRVGLTLHSRGFKKGSSWEPQQIQIADEQIISDWERLLGDPFTAKQLAHFVDIFNPLSEPIKNISGDPIQWTEWKSLGQKTAIIIRRNLKRDTIPITISGINYASDGEGVLTDPLEIDNSGIEIHPYHIFSKEANYKEFIEKTRAKKILTFVGEIGHEDPKEFLEEQYKLFIKNKTSFAVYALNSSSLSSSVLTSGEFVNPTGILATKYFQAIY